MLITKGVSQKLTQKYYMARGKSRFIRLRYVKLHTDDLYGNEQNIHEDQINRHNLLIVNEQIKLYFSEI